MSRLDALGEQVWDLLVLLPATPERARLLCSWARHRTVRAGGTWIVLDVSRLRHALIEGSDLDGMG